MKSTFFSLALAAVVSAAPLVQLLPRNTTSTTTSYTSGDTANDILAGVCAPLTVIFARGTTETGNIGKDVGPSLFANLTAIHGQSIALQGVEYPASWASNEDLGSAAGKTMASLVSQAHTQCKNTTVALVGYSQGALVVHSAMDEDSIKAGDVKVGVVFGDPENGLIPALLDSSLFKEFCAAGDNLCHHKALSESVDAHTGYGAEDGKTAATFINDVFLGQQEPEADNSIGEIIQGLIA